MPAGSVHAGIERTAEPRPSGDASGRFSVAFPRRWWYPLCQSGDLGRSPVDAELMDTPVVAFRDRSGRARVLVDRCPHRNVPLSRGRVTDAGDLQCGYHGWCFDGAGTCTDIPGLDIEPASPNRQVGWFDTAEADGFVWVWGEPATVGTGTPFPLPALRPDTVRNGRVGRTIFTVDIDSTMHAAIENALDVPHTAYLHGGIFRGAKEPRTITAVRRELDDGIEVQYLGEPIGFGPLTLRADQTDRTFDHYDRFFLPSIAQVEYGVDGWLRVFNSILHLPLGPLRTRAWFVLDYVSPLPPALAGPIIKARGRAILRQDVEMLAAQTERIRRFGGEQYTSTALDLLGSGIWRLLRRAERAERPGDGDTAADAPDGSGDDAVETRVELRL